MFNWLKLLFIAEYQRITATFKKPLSSKEIINCLKTQTAALFINCLYLKIKWKYLNKQKSVGERLEK